MSENLETSPPSSANPSQSSSTDSPPPQMKQWREISYHILQKSLPSNPLTTQPDIFSQEESHCLMALSSLSQPEDSPEAVFETLFPLHHVPKSAYRVALIGEAGTGKTLILQRFARWLWSNADAVPIFLTLTDLQDLSLEQYLYQKWLPQAEKVSQEKPESLKKDLPHLIDSGKLWLLLDGVDAAQGTASAPLVSPLIQIYTELRTWGQKLQIVLNCRQRSWQEAIAQESHYKTDFQCYYTRELHYPTEVNQFIKGWFAQENSQSAQSLIKALKEAPSLAYQQAVTLPLRLALFCRWWQQHTSEFPTTLTQLYHALVQEYYEWKAETLTLPRKKQETLKQWLGKWACAALIKPILAKRWVFEAEDNPETRTWLRWALQMAWLTPVSGSHPLSESQGYEFNDPTFAAYFAAMTIEEGDDFLKDLPQEIGESGLEANLAPYPRFFDERWQQVLFFWLGRSDVPEEQKGALLSKLITFEDNCGQFNFFGKISYLLAAKSLAHFPESALAQEIIDQVIIWSFPLSDDAITFSEQARETLSQTDRGLVVERLLERFLSPKTPEISDQAWKWLEKQTTLPKQGIDALIQLIKTSNIPKLRWQSAECLGKIVPGHPLALSVFTDLLTLESERGDDFKEIALKGLAKIGKQQSKAIRALLPLLLASQGTSLQRRVFQCLEMIGGGSNLAIAALVQLIRTSEDANFRRMAAECLEKIDPSNFLAITILVGLLQEGNSEEIKRMAVYSIGEVEPGNGEAIHGLVTLLNQTEDVLTRWVAISSLGKIGRDNPEATNTLVKLIESSEGLLLRKEAIESLGKLDGTHPAVISALAGWIQVGNDESLRREAAESLGRLDPGNPEAIAALSHLLQTADDPFTRRQAAASLGRIDSGNLEALNTLVQLLKNSQDGDIQSLAADSLGELGANNPAVIATLIRLLKSTQDKDTFRHITQSLGKIAQGNREVISTMMDLLCQYPQLTRMGVNGLKPHEDEINRFELAESLSKVLYKSQIPQIITLLQEFLEKHPNADNREAKDAVDLPCEQLLWYCATQLTYREYEQAWHQRIITNAVTRPSKQINNNIWLKELDEKLIKKPESDNIHLVCLDTGEFLDLENPAVDIYDQMLAQGCPEFPHGLPENLSKLRLYWQLLERDHPNQSFFFIFYGSLTHESALKSFWQVLRKFHSRISVVGQDPAEHFQKINGQSLNYFTADDPQLVEKLLAWINNLL